MDSTREFIIEQAFKLFLERSYDAVSINDISKAIGFTKGALYHHFRSKEELFISVVDRYLFIPEIDLDVDSVSLDKYIQVSIQQTEKMIKSLFSVTQVFSPLNYMSLFADAFRHYPGYREAKSSFISNETVKTEKVLEKAVRSGEIRSDINIPLIAVNLVSINMGLAGNLLRNNSIDDGIELLKKQMSEFYKLLKINSK